MTPDGLLAVYIARCRTDRPEPRAVQRPGRRASRAPRLLNPGALQPGGDVSSPTSFVERRAERAWPLVMRRDARAPGPELYSNVASNAISRRQPCSHDTERRQRRASSASTSDAARSVLLPLAKLRGRWRRLYSGPHRRQRHVRTFLTDGRERSGASDFQAHRRRRDRCCSACSTAHVARSGLFRVRTDGVGMQQSRGSAKCLTAGGRVRSATFAYDRTRFACRLSCSRLPSTGQFDLYSSSRRREPAPDTSQHERTDDSRSCTRSPPDTSRTSSRRPEPHGDGLRAVPRPRSTAAPSRREVNGPLAPGGARPRSSASPTSPDSRDGAPTLADLDVDGTARAVLRCPSIGSGSSVASQRPRVTTSGPVRDQSGRRALGVQRPCRIRRARNSSTQSIPRARHVRRYACPPAGFRVPSFGVFASDATQFVFTASV